MYIYPYKRVYIANADTYIQVLVVVASIGDSRHANGCSSTTGKGTHCCYTHLLANRSTTTICFCPDEIMKPLRTIVTRVKKKKGKTSIILPVCVTNACIPMILAKPWLRIRKNLSFLSDAEMHIRKWNDQLVFVAFDNEQCFKLLWNLWVLVV